MCGAVVVLSHSSILVRLVIPIVQLHNAVVTAILYNARATCHERSRKIVRSHKSLVMQRRNEQVDDTVREVQLLVLVVCLFDVLVSYLVELNRLYSCENVFWENGLVCRISHRLE